MFSRFQSVRAHRQFGSDSVRDKSTDKDTTGITRHSLASVTDSTTDPAIALDYRAKREDVNKEMNGHWSDDAELLEKVFPEASLPNLEFVHDSIKNDQWSSARGWFAMRQYSADEDYVREDFIKLVDIIHAKLSAASLSQSTASTSSDSGVPDSIIPMATGSGLPAAAETPTSGTPSPQPVTPNLSAPIVCFRGEFFDTHGTPIPTRQDGAWLEPDIFVQDGAGTSEKFLWERCRAVGDIKLRFKTKPNEKADTTRRRRTFGPRAGISKEFRERRAQLSSYAKQVFMAQENRRFLPGFLLDESRFHFFIFDRNGAVMSNSLDYQEHPLKLCQMVIGLITADDLQMGYDTSVVSFDGRVQRIVIPEDGGWRFESASPGPKEYIIDRTIFHSSRLVGNGAIYWVAHTQATEAEEAVSCIILDSWLVGGYEGQLSLLTVGQQYPQGLPPVMRMQNVQICGREDSVSNNRKGQSSSALRVHVRIVFSIEAEVKNLEDFSDSKELLGAIYDTVIGLRNLYISGNHHGSIGPYRILIRPNSLPGQRAIILHYEKYKTSGLQLRRNAFESRTALKGGEISHLDDLESLFYVLCHMVNCCPPGRKEPLRKAPEIFSQWFGHDGGKHHKLEFLSRKKYPIPIDRSFEAPIKVLLHDLHEFFNTRLGPHGYGWLSRDIDSDFKEFLNFITAALRDVSGASPSKLGIDYDSLPVVPRFERRGDVATLFKTLGQTTVHFGRVRPSGVLPFLDAEIASRMYCQSRLYPRSIPE